MSAAPAQQLDRLCSIAGCDRPAKARGWCKTHWARWRRHGDPYTVPERKAARPPLERALEKVAKDPATECWTWVGYCGADGYGRMHVWGPGQPRRPFLAHRIVYEGLVGPIPSGLSLDHLCRNTRCVNPDHLEPVSHAENVRRGRSGWVNREKTQCIHGHPFDEANTYRHPSGSRVCRECRRQRARDRRKAA